MHVFKVLKIFNKETFNSLFVLIVMGFILPLLRVF